ncbi:MAG: sigma-54-dependent Fis family transcriptional regulator [Spirochaetes bacterium]|nr:sigma-54-dependent Fis family transcriptional regulator [Spirochaetota bacterium]
MEKKEKILLVDDDTTALALLSEVLEEKGYEIETSSGVDEAIEKLNRSGYQVIIADLKMPGRSGMDLLHYTVKNFSEIPLIMLTAYGTIQNAVKALKEGAFDYIAKPVQIDELSIVLRKAINHKKLREQNIFLKKELQKLDDFLYITNNSEFSKIFDTIENIKSLRTTILLQGESGTGKEVIARYIHAMGNRSAGSFVPINCGAIPENLIESELFGYEKGAFTDAKKRTRGKLEIADGGTLFLDEIDELSPKAQVALLRFLQEKEITPLGSTRRISLNVRIITATNKDLKELVKQKDFRDDLFYRINVMPVYIPPLRERKEDILPFAEWYVDKFSHEYNKRVKRISKQAKELLLTYNWPGNIRELRNSIERAVIICKEEEIPPEAFHLEQDKESEPDFSKIGILPLKELENRYIHWVLNGLDGNKTLTASKLCISVRGLRYKLQNEEDTN